MGNLKNKNVIAEFEGDITIYQLNDPNETTAYTKSKRNLKKCWEEIQKTFNDQTQFNDIIKIFIKYEIKFNRYCAMD